MFGSVGPYFITVAMLLFAFTTLLGNLFYCEGCLNYIARRTLPNWQMNVFRVIAALVVFLGAQMELNLVWSIAEVMMGVMVLIKDVYKRQIIGCWCGSPPPRSPSG